jgi:hypothetical protein
VKEDKAVTVLKEDSDDETDAGGPSQGQGFVNDL